jgi:hypothetical protein
MKESEFGYQPLPNDEEFDYAVKILLNDKELGPLIGENKLQPHHPMSQPQGTIERTIAIGLEPSAGT